MDYESQQKANPGLLETDLNSTVPLVDDLPTVDESWEPAERVCDAKLLAAGLLLA